ncbi:M48 family metallopeptidase [Streptomyces sp. NRRL S-87]|uniref:M48 family metallopeptidase n=1 Tax=Streptomyces sp. NRRL S-87 TaxID=1463920 RepID=UPI0004C182CC|nr:M48 family metallopeptidase [Streptomyces sp. NRRL S-87]
MPVDEGYVTWCERCDWNVDPREPEPEPGRIDALRRRLAHRHGTRLLAELTAAGESARPHRDRVSVLAYALAVLVQGLMLVLVAVAVLLVVVGWETVVQPAVGVILLGAAWALRPRVARLPQEGPVLRRADAPGLFALVDEVAAVVGTRGVDAVVVTAEANAGVSTYGLRGRRVLVLGMGLWEVLGPRQRVALLGHELGHYAHGDTRRTALVGGALRSLAGWMYLLAPRRPRTLLDWVVNAQLALPWATAYAALAGMEHLTLRSSQRAEYLADRSAARAGSSGAAAELLDRLLLTGAIHGELRRESVAAQLSGGRAARDAAEQGLWERLTAFVAAVPDREYERLRRAGARRGHCADSTHPPTHLRRRYVLGGAPQRGAVDLSAERSEVVAAELAPARAVLARTVIRDFAG